ncbi:heterotrimeric G protein alpha subunit 4 [Mycena epipterygia]|nr:heterotrimeric G protein alpha subunit 4 [Mycena epipterygia]
MLTPSMMNSGQPFATCDPQSRHLILLLGSGDSGKSTILKQMRLNYGIPFSDSEIEAHRQLVFDNVTLGLNILIESLPDLELNLPDGLLPHADVIAKISNRDLRHQERFPQECLASLGALWNDATVQEAVTRGNEIALMDNLAYFFAVIPRLFSPSYVPTHQDILHVRARTIGITETTIKTPDMEMLVVDVGGAKSERRKWIHTFGDVTNIMFIASLCGYDTCLIEDRDANQDSMVLWDSICHGRWFKQTSLILCLNKNDLFEQKILDSDIAYFFPEFTGERSSAVAGRDFFKKKFRSLAHRAGRVNARDIYIHVTTATDIGLMGVLLNSFGACATST